MTPQLAKWINELKWKSVDKDNMEFEVRMTCYARDALLTAAADVEEAHLVDNATQEMEYLAAAEVKKPLDIQKTFIEEAHASVSSAAEVDRPTAFQVAVANAQIRADERERAARVAQFFSYDKICADIAAAIRKGD